MIKPEKELSDARSYLSHRLDIWKTQEFMQEIDPRPTRLVKTNGPGGETLNSVQWVLDFTSAGEVVKQTIPACEYKWHQHDETEVLVVLSGSFTLRFKDRDEVNLRPGSVYIIQKNTPHSATFHQTTELYAILIQPEGWDGYRRIK